MDSSPFFLGLNCIYDAMLKPRVYVHIMDTLVKIAKVEMEMLQHSDKDAFCNWVDGKWEKLTRGKTCTPDGTPQRCYHNAYTAAKANKGWTMYAGYASYQALGMLPLQHAWAVDEAGVVYDNTPSWAEQANVCYYGFKVPMKIAGPIFTYAGNNNGQFPASNDFFKDIDMAISTPDLLVASRFVDLATR